MTARKADRWIVLTLVAALAIEALLLFAHLGWIGNSKDLESRGSGTAGIIAKSENELRRRGNNSLVWEKSGADETLFFYDSVLTLNQSTATLKLAQGTEVELRENTLVTIEPVDESANGEIRLKFNRGSLATRNPFADTRIDAPEFSVALRSGSEMQLRQVAEDQFEMQLKKGTAEVTDKNGRRDLNNDHLLRIHQGQSQELKLDKALAWASPPPARIYSHQEVTEASLSWRGEASELRLQQTGVSEKIIPLSPTQRELKLNLNLGDYLAYLRRGSSTSPALPVQIWRAPVVHLIAPLPRNRLRVGESNLFLWTRSASVSSYILRAEGQNLKLREEGSANSRSLTFGHEDDAEWGIWAKDREGYEIPPLYKYPLFIREKPFAAPLLNAPRLRAPASPDGATYRLFDLMFPRAYAESPTQFEATFSWAKVEGAELYWIEISETADFRKPLVSQKVRGQEFIWRQFRDRSYFWRVAAGDNKGRMGVFSEPAQVSRGEGIDVREVAPDTGPQIELKPKLPPLVANKENLGSKERIEDLATRDQAVRDQAARDQAARDQAPRDSLISPPTKPSVAPSPVLEPPLEKPKIRARGRRLYWRGGYHLLNANAAENVKAKLKGPKVLALAADIDFLKRDQKWWNLYARYSQVTFKPEPPSEYPFQKDLKVQDFGLRLTRQKSDSYLGWGVVAGRYNTVARQDLEAIKMEQVLAAGVQMRLLYPFAYGEMESRIAALAGSRVFGGEASQQLIFKVGDRLRFGLGIELNILRKSSYQTLTTDGFVNLGFEF